MSSTRQHPPAVGHNRVPPDESRVYDLGRQLASELPLSQLLGGLFQPKCMR